MAIVIVLQQALRRAMAPAVRKRKEAGRPYALMRGQQSNDQQRVLTLSGYGCHR